jgi:hypothetical protein
MWVNERKRLEAADLIREGKKIGYTLVDLLRGLIREIPAPLLVSNGDAEALLEVIQQQVAVVDICVQRATLIDENYRRGVLPPYDPYDMTDATPESMEAADYVKEVDHRLDISSVPSQVTSFTLDSCCTADQLSRVRHLREPLGELISHRSLLNSENIAPSHDEGPTKPLWVPKYTLYKSLSSQGTEVTIEVDLSHRKDSSPVDPSHVSVSFLHGAFCIIKGHLLPDNGMIHNSRNAKDFEVTAKLPSGCDTSRAEYYGVTLGSQSLFRVVIPTLLRG